MTVKKLALCGIVAPIIFIVSLITFSLLTPNYSNSTNAVSELGTVGAPYALAWNALGLFLVGLLVILFAWVLHLDLRHSEGAIGVPILVALSGIGFAGVGLFPAEAGFEPSLRTTLHFTMVAVNLLPFILVAFLFAIRLKANNYWRKWIFFSVAMGVLDIGTFFIPQSVPGGISQRLGLGAYFLWLFVIGLALLRKPANIKS
jgi:hypothetical membrane protein